MHTLTVTEYRAKPWRGRLAYRLFRNPLVMFGIGPIYSLVIVPRLVRRGMKPRIRRSVILTNLSLAVVIGALCWLFGWREYLLVQAPTIWLAGAGGVFLFYVQHQFEDTYNLQRAHDENPVFHTVPTISLWDGVKAARLKLWDERSERLVTFRQARPVSAGLAQISSR